MCQGIEFENGGPVLISNLIKENMNGMDVSVLMGANVANEGARVRGLGGVRGWRRAGLDGRGAGVGVGLGWRWSGGEGGGGCGGGSGGCWVVRQKLRGCLAKAVAVQSP